VKLLGSTDDSDSNVAIRN